VSKQSSVILTIVIIEILFRLAYNFIGIDGLLYTLVARLSEMIVILAFAVNECGIKARSFIDEIIVGMKISIIFGAIAIIAEIASRPFIPDGILRLFLGRHHVSNPFLFFFVGCICGPFVEELFFRGLFYSWIRKRAPMILSILMSALFFASMHGFISPVQLIGGIVFAAVYERRKSIWAPYVIHAIGNTAIWALPNIM